jgi:hypothetical protein
VYLFINHEETNMSSATPAVPPPPLPELASLYEELSVAPQIDIMRSTTEAFVAEVHAVARTAADRNRSAPQPDLQIDTLLKALAGQLSNADSQHWSCKQQNDRRDKLLSANASRMLGRRLHTALGWDPEVAPLQPDPSFLSQLTWCALLLELDPPLQRRISHLAGFDLCAAHLQGKSCPELRDELVKYLQWKTRTIDGRRSPELARLAMSLLEPLYPELARDDLPSTLRYGSLAWSSFGHGLALAEAVRPGASENMNPEQLMALPLTLSETADEDELEVIAATCMRPALQWAVVQGKVAHREDGNYSAGDLIAAQRALDERRGKASQSLQALIAEVPDRYEMARYKLREVYGFMSSGLENYPLYPTSAAKRIEYSLRNPSPRVQANRFELLDVFAAGYTVNGDEDFTPHPYEQDDRGFQLLVPDLERLRGIHIPTLFEEAFQQYCQAAEAGYEFVIESLFEQLPPEDREALNRGAVSVYALQQGTDVEIDSETEHDRAVKRGRLGFIVQCHDARSPFSYEVFPLQAHLVRRTDLGRLPTDKRLEQVRKVGMSYPWSDPYAVFKQVGVPLEVDWQAYRDGRLPLPGQRATLVPVLLDSIEANPGASRTLSRIARIVARKHLFFYRSLLHEQRRRVAFVEHVSHSYPPVLKIMVPFIPGLSCINAVNTDESPAMTCALDIAVIIAGPLFKLFGATVKLIRQGGQLAAGSRLLGFAGQTTTFLGRTAASYAVAFNPVEAALPGYLAGRYLLRRGRRPIQAIRRLGASLRSRMPPTARQIFRLPPRIDNEMDYPMIVFGRNRTTWRNGDRIRTVEDFDHLDRVHGISLGRTNVRERVVEGLESGSRLQLHTRADGSRTVLELDQMGVRGDSGPEFIDIIDNSTVRLGGHYDYREILSWKCYQQAKALRVIELPANKVVITRSGLSPEKLAGFRNSIQQGIYMPPIDVEDLLDGRYLVINGNHRVQAGLELGLSTFPSRIAGFVPEQPDMQGLGALVRQGLAVEAASAPERQSRPESRAGTQTATPVASDLLSEEQKALLKDIDLAKLLRSTRVT